jgi:hypothetical protein
MRPHNAKEEKKLADTARMMRAWRRWHREQLAEVLQGPHGPMIERLIFILKELSLQSAPLLLAYIRGVDWSTVDADIKFVCLHEINTAIAAMRERHGMDSFNDPLPGQPENVSRLIKAHLFS